MRIVHRFIDCLACGARLEVFDDDLNFKEIECDCGYVNDFSDIRIEFYYDEY